MSDSMHTLFNEGVTMSVEPTGVLATDGWMAGVWVKYSTVPLTFSGAFVTVEISDGTGLMAGMLKTGPQHNQPVELLSDMWTTDSRQRAGGETAEDWTAFDAGAALDFDKVNQLQRMGSRIVKMMVAPSGLHKIYTYEKTGGGGPLVYGVNDKLYVSSNGYITKFQEDVAHLWTQYVVVKVGKDYEGDYIVIVGSVGV